MIAKKGLSITTQGAFSLGKQGEGGVLEIHFPQSATMIGETWEGNHQRSTDTAAYPVELEKQGNDLVWLVTSGDTAIPGTGRFELTCYNDDGQVLKSKTYSTSVAQSLLTGGNAPSGGYSKPTGTVYINSNGTHDVSKYANAQVDVPTSEGGVNPSGTLDIDENGTFDVTQYEKARVDVPIPEGYIKPAGTRTVTTNGTHDVESYKSVNVSVPTGSGVSGTVTIESNGVHDVSSYEKANVNVPVPDGYIQPSGTKTVTANGTHDIKSYENVTVNVPTPEGYIKPSGTKSVTSNGTHSVKEYENVYVNVPDSGVDTSDATLTAPLCPSGYTFYAGGEKKTGTMAALTTMPDSNVSEIEMNVYTGSLNVGYLASKNMYIKTGETVTTRLDRNRFGDATAADVVAGKTFTSANGLKLTGTYEAPSSSGGGEIYRTTATLDSSYSTASWKKLCNIPFLGENISNSGLFVILNRVSVSAVSNAVSICAASNGAYFNGNYFVSIIHGSYSASVDTLSSSNYTLSSSSSTSYTRIYADSSGNLYIRPDGSGTTFASGEYMILYGIF